MRGAGVEELDLFCGEVLPDVLFLVLPFLLGGLLFAVPLFLVVVLLVLLVRALTPGVVVFEVGDLVFLFFGLGLFFGADSLALFYRGVVGGGLYFGAIFPFFLKLVCGVFNGGSDGLGCFLAHLPSLDRNLRRPFSSLA